MKLFDVLNSPRYGAQSNEDIEVLREIVNYYRSLIAIMPGIVYRLDDQGRIISISDGIKQLGYEPDELIGKPFVDLIHPQDRFKSPYNFVEKSIGERRIKNLEVRFLVKSTGNLNNEITYRTMLLNARGQWNVPDEEIHRKDKKFICTQGIAVDITEQKKTALHLKQAAENFRNFIEESTLGIRIVTPEGKTIYANKAFLDLYGYDDLEEFKRTPVEQRYTKESLELHYKRRELRKKGIADPSEYEVDIIRKDGQVRHLKVFRKAIQWDNNWHYQVIYEDQTELKKAHEFLSKKEKFFRAIIENTSDVILIINENGFISYVSPSVVTILDYQLDELIEKELWAIVADEDIPRLKAEIEVAFSTQETPIPIHCRCKTKRGTQKFLSGVAKNLSHISAVGGMIINLRDVTEEKRAEDEKRRLESQLIQARKMEAIGTLAAGIAHEFNNLLMGIQGYTSLMLLSTDISHAHYEKLRGIEKQVQIGAELTKQLLAFSRQGRYEVEPTDLNRLISRMVSIFGKTKKEIRFHENYQEGLYLIDADQGQMEQVFLNLLINASQSMPAGGNVYVKTENIFIDTSFAAPYKIPPGNYVKITFKDTGTGIDEETKKRIFEPFFTTKEMGRGTGLGLATIYGIIKGHSGFIDVESEPGQGTTFIIYLPASKRSSTLRNNNLREETARGNETILVIDDERTVLEVTAEMLASLGYRVLTAENGESALTIFSEKNKEIQLIIMDMIMPDISAAELYERIREINPEVKVILASGYSMNGLARSILEKGVKAFIQKPYRLSELSTKVRNVLDESTANTFYTVNE
ncbi:MAG: PAS domain S-box protein [Syntrophales bacterium]|nr:PAS domain S-box protein [Syntrophales bacterium]